MFIHHCSSCDFIQSNDLHAHSYWSNVGSKSPLQSSHTKFLSWHSTQPLIEQPNNVGTLNNLTESNA